MAYKILITEKAEQDLDGIIQYLVGKLCNPDAAIHLLDAVEQLYGRLSETPFMYALCSHSLLSDREYRKAVLGGYLMLYRVEENTVFVERYFSDLEDYIQRL